MFDPRDDHHKIDIVDLVDDSVGSHTDPEEPSSGFDLFGSSGSWIRFEAQDAGVDALKNALRKGSKVALGLAGGLDTVGHLRPSLRRTSS